MHCVGGDSTVLTSVYQWMGSINDFVYNNRIDMCHCICNLYIIFIYYSWSRIRDVCKNERAREKEEQMMKKKKNEKNN